MKQGRNYVTLNITEGLTWALHTNSVVRKARQTFDEIPDIPSGIQFTFQHTAKHNLLCYGEKFDSKWLQMCITWSTSSVQFNFTYIAPNHNESHLMTLYIWNGPRLYSYSVIYRDPAIPTMSKHLATVARKNFLLRGRNLGQSRALGGRPSALTGWVEKERETGRQAGRQAETIIIIIEI